MLGSTQNALCSVAFLSQIRSGWCVPGCFSVNAQNASDLTPDRIIKATYSPSALSEECPPKNPLHRSERKRRAQFFFFWIPRKKNKPGDVAKNQRSRHKMTLCGGGMVQEKPRVWAQKPLSDPPDAGSRAGPTNESQCSSLYSNFSNMFFMNMWHEIITVLFCSHFFLSRVPLDLFFVFFLPTRVAQQRCLSEWLKECWHGRAPPKSHYCRG